MTSLAYDGSGYFGLISEQKKELEMCPPSLFMAVELPHKYICDTYTGNVDSTNPCTSAD